MMIYLISVSLLRTGDVDVSILATRSGVEESNGAISPHLI